MQRKWRRRLVGALRFEEEGENRGASKYNQGYERCLGMAAGSIEIQQKEADKDRRANCRIETQPYRGDMEEGWLRWRDNAEAPELIDEGSSKVSPGAADDCITLSLSTQNDRHEIPL